MPTKHAVIAAAVTFILTAFSAWLLPFGWQQRHLYFKDYTFSAEQAQALRHYPEAMLAFGQRAWFALDAEGAARYYRAVVTRDAGHMAAWLKLAEAEAAAGRPEKARAIVAFVERRAGEVMFWQWPTALLAHDLGLEDVFRRCTNRLATRGWKLSDTFNWWTPILPATRPPPWRPWPRQPGRPIWNGSCAGAAWRTPAPLGRS